VLFMIIERFANRDPVAAYRHLRDAGRGLPEGLSYVDSWVESNCDRCFQLMECDDLASLQQWILHWRGTGVSFEVVPVLRSAETRAVVAPLLDPPATGPIS
jgi:hypothetical protein